MAMDHPEKVNADHVNKDQHLQQLHTSDSSKGDLGLEAESIASALDGGSLNEPDRTHDLEKATTQDTRTSHEPATRTRTAADWDGPDDPGNSQNWPFYKKAYHVFAIGMIAFATTSGSSLISPAAPQIATDFGVSRTAALLSITVYVVGLATGPMIAAPISETFGRNVVYKCTGLIFMLFLIGAGFSKSFGGMLVCRLLAGMAGGPVLAVGAGSNADMFPLHQRAVATSFFIMMPFLGPSVGPVMGGFVAQYKGWRWTQWVTIFIGVAAYAFILPCQETYKKVILMKRSKKLGIPGPPTPPVKGWAWIKMLLTITLIRPLHMLCREPIVLFFSLYNAFTFSVLFGLFAAYPYTFQTVYGFNTWQFGLTFLGILVGVLCAVPTGIICDRLIYYPKYKKALENGKGAVPPEQRLYAAMLGSFGIPIGLFWFAWSARADVHWISPILAGIPFAWGNLSIFIASALYLVDVYGPLNGASAMAANGLARYGMGAVFPLFTFQMYETLGIDWASSLLAFISVAMLPIPWVFFKYGPKIRSKSAYDTLKA